VNSTGGLSFRLLADGRTLVAFCPMDGAVDWFDLVQLKLTHEVMVAQRNPFWQSPVFSQDGNTLYLHEGGTGALHAIDLIHRTIAKSTKVAAADANPLSWLGSILVMPVDAGAIERSVAASPDGNWLYAVGAFGAPGGVALVHLPDLGVKGRWLPDASLWSVWVSADGRTIYVLEKGDQLRVLRADGSQVAKLSLPANTFGFIVPTTP
jgi:DNA-binding beta-propeller fold protein YncE